MSKSLTVRSLEAAIQNASSLDDLKRLVEDASAMKLMHEDGTVRGLHYCAASRTRGAVLQVAIRRGTPNGFTTSLTVDGKDFRTVYREAVNTIVDHHGIGERSELVKKMHDSVDAFLAKNGLQLTEIRYEQVAKVSS